MKKIAEEIIRRRVLENFELSESYFYNGIPLCVIDSIYSIGVRYESVKNVISNFCDHQNIMKHRISKQELPKKDEQYKVSDFLKMFEKFNTESLAKDVFKNSQRTSTKSGILKSEAVFKFLTILNKYGIDTFQDLGKMNEEIENEILKIRGQKSGISLQYFYMLAGSNELIKPDRMIIRFLKNILEREKITIEESLGIITQTCEVLESDFEVKITPRELDNAIWNYQRNQ